MRTPQAAPGLSGNMSRCCRGQAGAPAFILTVDAATKNFTVRKVGATPEPGKSYELWLDLRQAAAAALARRDRRQRLHRAPGAVGYDQDVINGATYAVTVEQAGGSPDGVPHSTPIYTGQADRDRAARDTGSEPIGFGERRIHCEQIPHKRKTPVGGGRFLCSRLGVGLLHIHVATLGGW